MKRCEVLNEDDKMNDSENKIECSEHGTSFATFVCNHLTKGEKIGFNIGYDPDNPDEIYPDAWCNKCEEILESEGEWNEISEKYADIKVLCSQCYLEIRESNWIQDNNAYHDLICSSFSYLQDKQDDFMEEFKINDHERWDWHQETGALVFSHNGKAQVEAKVSFSGSVSTHSDTWMWAWSNDSLLEDIKADSRRIRLLGEKHNYKNLVSSLWPAKENDGWEMTAIMAKELGAIGAYRTSDENGFTYMIVKSAKWVNKSPKLKPLKKIFSFMNRKKI